MEEEEGHILADLSILEFYLHRSIQLRLGAFGKSDDDSISDLKLAHLQTVIVSDMIKMMMSMLGGSFDDLPLDPVLRTRLNFGGLLGLLLFSDAETLEKRMEAMVKALPVLNQLATASRCKSLQKPLFELKKIVLLWSSKNSIEAIEEFESIFGDSLPAEDTERGKQALLDEEDFKRTREEVLSELNLKHFDRLMIDGLRQAYELVEPPLIAKMSKSQVSSMAASKETMHQDEGTAGLEESQPSMNLYTQAPYMTQIPSQEPATQAFRDTQSSLFPETVAGHALDTEVTLPASIQATNVTSETLELLTPSPAVIAPSPAVITTRPIVGTPSPVVLPQSTPTALPPSTQDALPLSIQDDARGPEISKTTNRTTKDNNETVGKEASVHSDDDNMGTADSFQPATQMPFDDGNVELELEEEHLEESAVQEPVLPTMSAGISIQADELEDGSPSEEPSDNEKAISKGESGDEEDQLVTKIPFEFFSRLLKYCDEDPKDFFATPDETIDRLYARYQKYQEDIEEDKSLPSLESLLPRESSPIRPAVKKRVVFESEADFEEPPAPVRQPILKKAKKSMLLPNSTSKKVDWDSLTPSSPTTTTKENESLEHNSKEDEPFRLRKKQQKGRRPFTEEETANLVDGVRKYGRKWAVILTCYRFNDRTSVDLKDKARNLAKKGLINLPAVADE